MLNAFTAVGAIGEEQKKAEELEHGYSEDELNKLDAAEAEYQSVKAEAERVMALYKENVTTPDQYELLEMSHISGFIDRAKGAGRPTKKDRRNLEEFTTPEFMDDFDFEFDFEEE